MVESIENTSSVKPNNARPLPFILKAAALLLIVYGIIGLGYYLFTTIFSLSNPQFLENIEFNNFKGNTLFIPVTIKILVHISIVLSGFLIFYKKKAGRWFFYFSLFFSLFFFIVFTSYINYAEIVIGFLVLVILFVYRSRLS